MNLIDKLNKLNPQQVAKVLKLIDKLSAKNAGEPVKQEKSIQAKPTQKVVVDKDTDTVVFRQKERRQKRGDGSTSYARPAPLFTGPRENKWEKMPESKTHGDEAENSVYNKIRDDVVAPVPRGERVGKVEVKCVVCRDEYSVNPKMVTYKDGKPNWTCNDCILSRNRRRG